MHLVVAVEMVAKRRVVFAEIMVVVVVVVEVVADGGDDVGPNGGVQQGLSDLVEEDDDVAHKLAQESPKIEEAHS